MATPLAYDVNGYSANVLVSPLVTNDVLNSNVSEAGNGFVSTQTVSVVKEYSNVYPGGAVTTFDSLNSNIAESANGYTTGGTISLNDINFQYVIQITQANSQSYYTNYYSNLATASTQIWSLS